jgi:hypothetical protein
MRRSYRHWLSLCLGFTMAGAGLGSQGRKAAQLPPSATNAQVQEYYRKAQAYLAKSDLPRARFAAVKAWEAAKIEPRFSVEGEPIPEVVYLFPEGEALRFFMRRRENPLLFVELKNGGVILRWQAHLKRDGGRGPTRNTLLFGYLSGLSVDAQFGRKPAIHKPLVFFEFHPMVGDVHYGRVTAGGRGGFIKVLTNVRSEQLRDRGVFVTILGEKVAGHVH